MAFLSTSSPEQEWLFSEAITRIRALLKERELIDVLPQFLYLHKDGAWSLRFDSTGCDMHLPTLEKIMLELACHEMGGVNLGLMCIKDQETFDKLFDKLLGYMRETEARLLSIEK